jgi:prepilin-type N-terminal cleavage/methylation domain-containing protein/prepilin-type processing-associated H-X9-DG protein
MRCRGFTLVELLVVIAILAMLVSILIPALRLSREQARVAVCGAKIRSLLIGLHNYEAANGTFPYGFEHAGDPAPPGPFAGSVAPTIDPMGLWWFDFSQKVDHLFGDGLEVLKCPSKRQDDLRLQDNLLSGNYGANLWLCRTRGFLRPYLVHYEGIPRSSSNTPQPASTLLLADSGYALICWWHATAEPPVELPILPCLQNTAYVPGLSINRSKPLLPGQATDAVNGRHPGKTVNIGFVDGHMDRQPAEALLVEKTGEDEWDFSPIWQPSSRTVTALGTPP